SGFTACCCCCWRAVVFPYSHTAAAVRQARSNGPAPQPQRHPGAFPCRSLLPAHVYFNPRPALTQSEQPQQYSSADQSIVRVVRGRRGVRPPTSTNETQSSAAPAAGFDI